MHEAPYRRIPLRNRAGETVAETLVDEADYARVAAHRWCLGGARNAYARRRANDRNIYLHRWLLGLGYGDRQQADHRNGNKLDNRRANLRVVPSQAEQVQNLSHGWGRSKLRGVQWNPRTKKWIACARMDGKNRHLGTFATEEEAGRVAAAFRREHMPYAIETA